MVQDYYFLLKKVREMRRNYKSLDIDSKIALLTLEMKVEGKDIKHINECHTKAEKRANKSKRALIRKHNTKNKIQSK